MSKRLLCFPLQQNEYTKNDVSSGRLFLKYKSPHTRLFFTIPSICFVPSMCTFEKLENNATGLDFARMFRVLLEIVSSNIGDTSDKRRFFNRAAGDDVLENNDEKVPRFTLHMEYIIDNSYTGDISDTQFADCIGVRFMLSIYDQTLHIDNGLKHVLMCNNMWKTRTVERPARQSKRRKAGSRACPAEQGA